MPLQGLSFSFSVLIWILIPIPLLWGLVPWWFSSRLRGLIFSCRSAALCLCVSAVILLVATLITPAAPVVQPSPSIILISVDTLRADRLSCYGSGGRPTPNIDAIAQGGTLFSQVSCQVPLTLPSHVSLLTSSYPFTNGITDNGQQLGPNAMTLATLLKSRGYRTAAFVGGFVLDRRFGLNQGFDFYDGSFDLHRQRGIDPGDVKRLGEDVVRAATHWLQENSERPFFLFLHLYDLHTPYDLPPALRKRFPGTGYEAELAYVDEVLGGFWNYLVQQRLPEKAVIVFTSDHGESLGDHGESTHGYFIYQSTLRVPLIIHWPLGVKGFAARVDEPASLLDVAPTLLQFVGLERPSGFQGRSLLGWAHDKPPGADEGVYSESLYARNHFGCSSLQSLRLGRYKYIEAPKPEFYDLAKDPGETQNLYSLKKALALSLRERLQALRSRFQAARSAESRALSPEVVAALSSLGYVAASNVTSDPVESRPDPKDRISDSESYSRALALSSSGQLAEANLRLERLQAKFPEVVDIRLSLGVNQQRLRQHKQAAQNFRLVLKQDPLNVLGHFNLAVSYSELQQVDDAIKELQAVLAIAPYYTRADELLGTLWIQKKDYEQARAHFNHLLTTSPEDYTAHYNLGVLATLQGKWSEGENHLRSALATDPKSAEAYNTLGSLYLRQGALDQARQALAEAIRLEPKFAWARYNLGLVFRQQKRNEEAVREFREALAADPKFQAAREALERLERP